MNLIETTSIQFELLGHVLLAMFLGALIGVEREFADKPAGLRTHMPVSGAAALLVSISALVVHSFQANFISDIVRTDPVRVLEAVITGISFLGAGTILRDRSSGVVEGLTTAASLLLTAGIGVAVALGQWILAVGVTLLVLMTLSGAKYLEQWLNRFRKSDSGSKSRA